MTIAGRRPDRNPPQFWEVWDRLRVRLLTGNFTKLLLGPDRVYVAGDRIKDAEDRLDRPWGRLVLTPATTAWETEEQLGRDSLLPFLIRTDYYAPVDSNFHADRWHDAAQLEVFRLLHGYGPILDMQYARVEHLIHRQTAPQPMAIWDEPRGVWFKSTVYHVFVSPPALGG